MSLILGAQSATATAALTIPNSCRFNGSDSKLQKTATSDTPTLATKSTLSFWIKSCSGTVDPTGSQAVTYTNNAVAPYFQLQWPGQAIAGDHPVPFYQNYVTGGNTLLYGDQYLRDHSAWRHVCISYDSTPATPSSTSIKMFINGTQVTAFQTETYPGQDVASAMTAASQDYLIGINPTPANPVNGYLAEFMIVDGQALNADSFGQFNSDSPTIWEPIDITGITLGNQGFHLDFQDSSNLGNDVGGGTDFTSTNLAAIDQTTDTPSNNFCVVNLLDNYYQSSTFSEGNCKIVTPGAAVGTFNTGTIALSAGLWYFEVKVVDSANQNATLGISDIVTTSTYTGSYLGFKPNSYAYYGDGRSITNETYTAYGDSYDDGDVVGVYIDLTANKLYFAKNGTVQNSGTGISITAVASTANGIYFPAFGDNYTNTTLGVADLEMNFGNPVAALTSAVSDANGYGNFEYDPSAGTFDGSSKDFLAICTQNLGSDGG
jgi:hypothetical protein